MIVRATRDFAWIVARTGCYLGPDARGIVAESEGHVVGMVVYDQWTRNACTGHIAVDRPQAWFALRRPLFRYPFIEADKGVLLAGVASTNERSLRMMRGLGFREICRVADAVAVGVDSVLFAMRREECRYLEEGR